MDSERLLGRYVLSAQPHGNFEDSIEKSQADEEKSIKHIQNMDPKGEMVMPCIQPRGGRAPLDLMKGLGKMCQNGGG
jgi:hypothetical protein